MKSVFLLVSLLMTLAHAPAKDSPSPVPVLPESTARVFTLENGLTLIIEEDHSAPVVGVASLVCDRQHRRGKMDGSGPLAYSRAHALQRHAGS